MKRAAKQTTISFKKAKPQVAESGTNDKNAEESTLNRQDTSAKSSAAPPGDASVWDKQRWIESLDKDTRELLGTEIAYLDDTWLCELHPELTKPYFLSLKKFINARRAAGKKIYPPAEQTYSWSNLCSLKDTKVVILGQDPYHRPNQAHGLAFSVNPPTRAPPSLLNIYKELEACYPEFKRPASGNLTPWAEQGVLLLNTCLTVEEGQANSHAKKGWETFTQQVLKTIAAKNDHVVFMAWGSPALKRITDIKPGPQHLVLKSVHPSPLSASRGWFGSKHFPQANAFLEEKQRPAINWLLADQN